MVLCVTLFLSLSHIWVTAHQLVLTTSSQLPAVAIILHTGFCVCPLWEKLINEGTWECCGLSRGWIPKSMLLFQGAFPGDSSCQWQRKPTVWVRWCLVAAQHSPIGSQLTGRLWSPASALPNWVASTIHKTLGASVSPSIQWRLTDFPGLLRGLNKIQ